MTEQEKRNRFNKVATNRVNKILDTLRLLGNCSNTSNYAYTDEEVDKIFNAIELELADQKEKFKRKERKKFKL